MLRTSICCHRRWRRRFCRIMASEEAMCTCTKRPLWYGRRGGAGVRESGCRRLAGPTWATSTSSACLLKTQSGRRRKLPAGGRPSDCRRLQPPWRRRLGRGRGARQGWRARRGWRLSALRSELQVLGRVEAVQGAYEPPGAGLGEHHGRIAHVRVLLHVGGAVQLCGRAGKATGVHLPQVMVGASPAPGEHNGLPAAHHRAALGHAVDHRGRAPGHVHDRETRGASQDGERQCTGGSKAPILSKPPHPRVSMLAGSCPRGAPLPTGLATVRCGWCGFWGSPA